MIMRSSFLPVRKVIDWPWSTSLSFFRPSGVSSNAHAKTSAGMNPMASNTTMMRAGAGPKSNRGKMVSATWISSQAATIYATPTRTTLRRFSSFHSNFKFLSNLKFLHL